MTFRAGESPGVWTVNLASPRVQRMLQSLLFGATGSLSHQFARYLVVGGLAFVVDFGSLYLLTEFAGFHYLISAAIAYLFGLIISYCSSLLWVFNRRTMENVGVELVIFIAIGIVGLGLSEVIIWFGREKLHFHYMIAKAISSGIVLIWNFGARKLVLFR